MRKKNKKGQYSKKNILVIVIIAIILLGGSKYSKDISQLRNIFFNSESSENANYESKEDSSLSGKVTHVSDGDTATLKDSNGTKHRIRLNGIDAPEIGQEYGIEAKSFLEDLVLNKNVDVEIIGKDQFDRILGVIKLNNKDINKEMLKNGLAWQYRFNNDISYSDMVKQAKQAKKNIWSDSNPIDPYIWRKQQDQNK